MTSPADHAGRAGIRTSKQDELRIVRQPLPRHDQAEKIAGSTRYAADLALAHMLHARLVRCPVPSAKIARRDATDALAVPGVVAVLFGEDVPHNLIRVDVPGQALEVAALKASMEVLATDRVRFHGEPVALVVAETEDVLAEACDLVEVDYAELPAVFEPADALQDSAPAVHEDGNLLSEWNLDTGDIAAAFASADAVVEGSYQTQAVDHAYLEPEAGVGWLDDEGVLNLRVATQVVEHYRDVARILGVPEARVRVIAPYVGGGFGGKEDMTVEPYLALAVWRTGREVRMEWSRQESLQARAKRHPMRMRYRPAARGLPRLRRHAGRARLRITDRRGGAQARPAARRGPQAQLAGQGRRAARGPADRDRGAAGADHRRRPRAGRPAAGVLRP